MINTIYKTIIIQLITFIRIKQVVFWLFVFPLTLFVIFKTIFGGINSINDKEYTILLLTGIIAMTVASDSLFSIGPVIKRHYLNGTLKILKLMPLKLTHYFIGIILSRFIISLLLLISLNIASYVLFSASLDVKNMINVSVGILAGLWIFSFIGLCLTFSDIKIGEAEKGLTNLVFFLILFTSNALYPVNILNESIANIADYLPMNPVLSVLRHDNPILFFQLFFWGIAPVIVFYFLYKKLKFTR